MLHRGMQRESYGVLGEGEISSAQDRGYGADFAKKFQLRRKNCVAALTYSRQRKQGALRVCGPGRDAGRQGVYHGWSVEIMGSIGHTGLEYHPGLPGVYSGDSGGWVPKGLELLRNAIEPVF